MSFLSRSRQPYKTVLTLQVMFVVGLALVGMVNGVFPTPELLFLLLLVAAGWKAETRRFLRDFFPFLLLLLSYQALRGYADNLAQSEVHITDLIAWERALCFGVVPAAELHRTLYATHWGELLVIATNTVYLSHFVVPFAVALLLWQRAHTRYWPFMIGLMGLSYAGFLTYLLFPAAPPWLAHQWGFLPDQVHMKTYGAFPTLLLKASPNAVAAMPSLHAAYPTYMAAVCLWTWGRKAWALLLLPPAVMFSTVYLGHHYVVDLLAGVAYGGAAFALMRWWVARRDAREATAGAAAAISASEPELTRTL